MTPWKVIAYHTDDDLYNEEIEKLRVSLLKFGISHYIETIPVQPSWGETHEYMHTRIRAAFDRFPNHNLVYLDADAVVRQYPVLFDTISEDIAVHYRADIELLAGTIYLKNCAATKEIVELWAKRSKERTDRLSGQKGLDDVLKTGKYSVYKLPAPYTLIFDSMRLLGPPVIEHFQASRRCGR